MRAAVGTVRRVEPAGRPPPPAEGGVLGHFAGQALAAGLLSMEAENLTWPSREAFRPRSCTGSPIAGSPGQWPMPIASPPGELTAQPPCPGVGSWVRWAERPCLRPVPLSRLGLAGWFGRGNTATVLAAPLRRPPRSPWPEVGATHLRPRRCPPAPASCRACRRSRRRRSSRSSRQASRTPPAPVGVTRAGQQDAAAAGDRGAVPIRDRRSSRTERAVRHARGGPPGPW